VIDEDGEDADAVDEDRALAASRLAVLRGKLRFAQFLLDVVTAAGGGAGPEPARGRDAERPA
jgi:hypothetical protein